MTESVVPRHQRVSRFATFPFGVAYYPEHWDRTWIEADAALMAKASVNTVRMAEFAWTLMEPSRGQFDFSLFQDAIAALKAKSIRSILCTPTAAPPRWLTADHPEWMRVDIQGVPFSHGTRQHCCTNNPEFRAESRRITRTMAEAFADEDAVMGWQTDNEFYCHVDTCYCSSCQSAFRAWLENKYAGRINDLNVAWGTLFWSQQYDTFAQIEIPRDGRQPAPQNPTALVDFRLFLSDSIRSFQKEQIDILREINPRWWVTHNGLFHHIDFFAFTEDLDFLSVDVYPAFWGTRPENFVGASLLNERCRAASGTYMVPEQCGGPGGQADFLQPTPEIGRMRLWAYQSIAHGADGILHFRWRTCRYGAEIHWHGILDHDNVPRRRFEEFSQEGRELAKIGPRLLGTSVRIDVGICMDYHQDHALAVMPMGRPSAAEQRQALLESLLTRKIAAGLVHQADSFAGLKVLILPSFILMDENLSAKLTAFVSSGGILLASATTGQRDLHNNARPETPPGLLREVFGLSVSEFGKTMHRAMTLQGENFSLPCDYYEILELESAQPLARWHFAENASVEAAHHQTAFARKNFGQGVAYYLGTFFTKTNCQTILDTICADANLQPLADAADSVEVIERRAADRRLTFLLNHYASEQTATGFPAGTDLLTGNYAEKTFTLPPFGVAIIESAADNAS